MGNQSINRRLLNIYHRLMARYGPQDWWPAEKPFEVIDGQATKWSIDGIEPFSIEVSDGILYVVDQKSNTLKQLLQLQ